MIRQGQTYKDKRTGCTVMAMESGEVARVRELVLGEPWLGREYAALAEWLEELPMRYHGNQTPTQSVSKPAFTVEVGEITEQMLSERWSPPLLITIFNEVPVEVSYEMRTL